MNLHVQLIILLIASGLSESLNAAQNELEKQIAALKIRLDRQDVELKELKGIIDVQNKRLNVLDEDLQQKLQNHSDMIASDLQNQRQQLENLTYLSQSLSEQDGSGLEQEIYELFNNQQRQIEYLMEEREELKRNDTKLQLMMQAEIDTADIKFLNITDDHYEQIKTLTEQVEKLQDVLAAVIRLHPLNEVNQIQIIKSFIGTECKWPRQDDGISFSKSAQSLAN